jgi:hypothetical protein
MDPLIPFLTPIDDDLQNLIYDDSQLNKSDFKRLVVYNQNIKDHLQKIWLDVPKLKLTNKILMIKNKKENSSDKKALMNLILYEINPEIKKFREFFQNIESKISEEMVKLNYDHLDLKSCIESHNQFFPKLTLPIYLTKNINKEAYDCDFDIYNNNNLKIPYSDIKAGSFVKLYIEINDIWVNDKNFGLNLKILQMKAYPDFDFKKCVFNDGPKNYEFIDQPKLSIPPPPPMLKLNNKPNNKENNNTNPFIPSVDELLKIRNKLKPKTIIPDLIIEQIYDEIIDSPIEEEIIEPIIIEPIIIPKKKIIKKKIVKRIIKKT